MATYSFLDVQAAIVGPGGSFNLGSGAGVAEEGITIERADDKNMMSIGADGTPMHTLRAGKSGTLTIRVQKTSPVNQQLAVMYDLQAISSAAWGKNVVSVRNVATGDSTTCQSVAFKKFTNVTYAKDANMQEWAFDVGVIDSILGDAA